MFKSLEKTWTFLMTCGFAVKGKVQVQVGVQWAMLVVGRLGLWFCWYCECESKGKKKEEVESFASSDLDFLCEFFGDACFVLVLFVFFKVSEGGCRCFSFSFEDDDSYLGYGYDTRPNDKSTTITSTVSACTIVLCSTPTLLQRRRHKKCSFFLTIKHLSISCLTCI